MKRKKKFKNFLWLGLFSFAVATPVVLTSCASSSETTSTYAKDDLYSTYSGLGTQVASSMQSGVKNNNFAFFGGSDLYDYDMYYNNGYRSFVDLFSDYFRYNGPYKLDDSTYNFDTTTKRYVIGSRYVFDFSSSSATLESLLSSYNSLVSGNNIKTTILTIDSNDINNIADTTYAENFATNLRRFILLATSQNNNKGIIIIQKHFMTNDEEFNSLVTQTNSVINSVVESFADTTDIFSRIGLVDHSKNSDNDDFKSQCLDPYNHLNATGNLELLNQFVDSLYDSHTSISDWTGSTSDITNTAVNHTISSNSANYVQTADTTKTTAFETYLTANSSLRWVFVGDSLTNASYFTKGYNGIVDYFKWLLKHDLNRTSDTVINMGIHSNTFEYEYDNSVYGSNYNFLAYAPDVVHLWLGINDIYNIEAATQISNQYFTNYLDQTLTDLVAVNSDAYLVVSTIPYPKGDSVTDTITTAIGNANIAIRNFATNNTNVILNDLSAVVEDILVINADYQSDLYYSDLLHYQSTAYVAFTKNLLTSLGMSFSTSDFASF